MRVENYLSADFFEIFTTGSCEFFFTPAMPNTLTIKASAEYYILLNDDENHFFIVISMYFCEISYSSEIVVN